jgi:hypothetical protein
MKSKASLPFKLEAQSKGAQKAYKNFQNEYGQHHGHDLFLKKAEEQGTGNTIRQKVNSTFKKGAKKGSDGKFR